ncbi:MAG: sulfite exporter TauE/SafE family protein [Bradymonadales bacterium]|nr:sulfite exporter TauE/SafE family protein [Bradymonadales bacterium]
MVATIFLGLIVCAAFLIEAALGFGATVVAVALGALLFPINEILPAFVPLNLVLSLFIVLKYRRDVSWGLLLKRILPLMVVGLPFGMLLFGAGENQLLSLLFGVFVILLAGFELLELSRRSGQAHRPLGPVAKAAYLLAGGVIHGAYATGGPMAIYVAGREGLQKVQFRSTLCALWLILNSILVLNYLLIGALTPASGKLSLVLVAPLLVGMLAGDWIQTRINHKVFTILVFLLLLVAGVVLVIRS